MEQVKSQTADILGPNNFNIVRTEGEEAGMLTVILVRSTRRQKHSKKSDGSRFNLFQKPPSSPARPLPNPHLLPQIKSCKETSHICIHENKVVFDKRHV